MLICSCRQSNMAATLHVNIKSYYIKTEFGTQVYCIKKKLLVLTAFRVNAVCCVFTGVPVSCVCLFALSHLFYYF